MKLCDLDVAELDLNLRFFQATVPASAKNFHAYSSGGEDGFAYGISYLADLNTGDKTTKVVKFQFASFGEEIVDNSVLIGTIMKYAIHVFIIA